MEELIAVGQTASVLGSHILISALPALVDAAEAAGALPPDLADLDLD